MHIPSMKELVSEEEWTLRCELAAAYRLVAMYGWSDLVFTHISLRLPDSITGGQAQFLINPYGLMFDEITASSLVKIDMDCNKLLPTEFPVNPAGFTIHSAIHVPSKYHASTHIDEHAHIPKSDHPSFRNGCKKFETRFHSNSTRKMRVKVNSNARNILASSEPSFGKT